MKNYLFILLLFLGCTTTKAQCIDEIDCFGPQETINDTILFYYYKYLDGSEIGVVGSRIIIDTIYKNNCIISKPYAGYVVPDYVSVKWFFETTSTNIFETLYPPPITYNQLGMYPVFFICKGENLIAYAGGVIVVIDHLPESNFTANSLSICAGECLNVEDKSQHYPTAWQWYFEGADTPFSAEQHPKNICYSTPGTYTVQLISSNTAGSDTIMQAIEVTDYLPTDSNTPKQFSLFPNENANLNACGIAETYTWQPTTGLSCTTCPNPIATPQNTTTYTCTLQTDGFCETVCTYNIHIKQRQLIIPNAFSPNGDGINDILPIIEDGATLKYFSVYNRWGQKVYETTSNTQGWDGNYQNEIVAAGVYIWSAEYEIQENNTSKILIDKGNITLVK